MNRLSKVKRYYSDGVSTVELLEGLDENGLPKWRQLYDHPRVTHITTLGDNTPKSRRRVRATLGLDEGAGITLQHIIDAMDIARTNERAEAVRVAKARTTATLA